MQEFSFTLTRDTTESVTVEIWANSIEEAHEKALESPPAKGWQQDDCSHKPYLPDPSDYEILGKREPEMCGGCGAIHPDQRCIGCLHDFYPRKK